MKHELTEGLLLNENGDLNEAGFSLCPVKTYERKQIKGLKWRIKEWDYYYIGNSKYGLCVTISDVSFLGLFSVTFLDFESKGQPAKTVIKPFTFGKIGLPSSSKEGNVAYEDKKFSLAFKHENGKRHIIANIKDFQKDKYLFADVVLEETNKDSIVVALPFFKKRHFYYNQKINGMKATGYVKIGDDKYDFGDDALATLDWGRGVWTYKNTWLWSNMNGYVDGKRIGFNLGYGFGDNSNGTENIFYYNDKAYKLDDVKFEIPVDAKGNDDFLSEWKFTSEKGDINLTFKPILNRHDDTNVLIIRSKQNQVFGLFSGTFKVEGKEIKFENILGFAEKVYNRW